MKVLKITSYIFAVLAAVFLLLAIMVATGVLGSSSGFMDLTNVVAIVILGIGLFCSIVASLSALIYKTKNLKLASRAAAKTQGNNTHKFENYWFFFYKSM